MEQQRHSPAVGEANYPIFQATDAGRVISGPASGAQFASSFLVIEDDPKTPDLESKHTVGSFSAHSLHEPAMRGLVCS